MRTSFYYRSLTSLEELNPIIPKNLPEFTVNPPWTIMKLPQAILLFIYPPTRKVTEKFKWLCLLELFVNIKIQIILLKLMWHKLSHSIRLIQYPLEKSFVRFKYLKNLQLHLHRLNPRPKGYLFKEPLYFLKATVTTNHLKISQYSRNLHKNAHSLSRLQQKIQPSARKFQKLLILHTEIRFQLKNQTIQSNIFQV